MNRFPPLRRLTPVDYPHRTFIADLHIRWIASGRSASVCCAEVLEIRIEDESMSPFVRIQVARVHDEAHERVGSNRRHLRVMPLAKPRLPRAVLAQGSNGRFRGSEKCGEPCSERRCV